MLINDLLADFNGNQHFTAQGKLDVLLGAQDLFPEPVLHNSLFISSKENAAGHEFTLNDVFSGTLSAGRVFGLNLLIGSRHGEKAVLLSPDQLLLAVLLTQRNVNPASLPADSFTSLFKEAILRQFSILLTAVENASNGTRSPHHSLVSGIAKKMVDDFPQEVGRFLTGTLKERASPLDSSPSRDALKTQVTPGSVLIAIKSPVRPYFKGGRTLEAQLLRARFSKLDLISSENLQAFKHDDLLTYQIEARPATTHSFPLNDDSDLQSTLVTFVGMFNSFYDTLVEDIENTYTDEYYLMEMEDAPERAFDLAIRTCASL